MKIKYLAVDSDIALAESEAAGWAEHGIGMVRVDSMTEAIQRLMINDDYLYIGINGNVVDFLPTLKTMSSVTDVPILVADTNFTPEKQSEAINNGAVFYGQLHETPEKNISVVTSFVNMLNERTNIKREAPNVFIYEHILIDFEHHETFVHDKKIALTKVDMIIFHCLLLKRGRTVTHEKLQQLAWNDEKDISVYTIHNAVGRLRGKLNSFSNDIDIENIRGIGYRITT
jgi:DNA-binding response OmpR family regulator